MSIKILLILIFAPVCLFACGTGEKTPAPSFDNSFDSPSETPGEPVYRKISAAEAREIMESAKDFILLDVRTESEFIEQRISGATLIPDFEIADRAESELPDKDALILIYCRSGRRSADAAHGLLAMGYTNVYDFGGILDWDFETING